MPSRPPTSLTLREALGLAEEYWEAKGPSSRMMTTRAKTCLAKLGNAPYLDRKRVDELDPTTGTYLLTALRNRGLSKSSIAAYYAAFRRMVSLAGGSTDKWPGAGKPPRRVREPLRDEDLTKLEYVLSNGRYSYTTWRGRSKRETADLLVLLRGTGMRVEVEALSWDAWTWRPEDRTVRIVGKGQHERIVPVEDAACITLLNDPERLKRMRHISYSGHLKRWKEATARLKITTLLPTPHAVRHWWATKVYKGSGKDLVLTQEMLGHADVSTTARYIGVDVEEARTALRAA